jgi:hypothetical protein
VPPSPLAAKPVTKKKKPVKKGSTASGRIKKGEPTDRVQCTGTTKKGARCAFFKAVRRGEMWDCGRHG